MPEARRWVQRFAPDAGPAPCYPARMPRAWVRPVPDRYVEATRGEMSDGLGAIDLALARRQHAAYAEGLRWLGFHVTELPAAHHLPDSVFVEDPAVLVDQVALIARSAHPVRALEAASVRAGLAAAGFRVVEMAEGATLDGGDVLEVGHRLFVSPSGRTNEAGIDALRGAFPDRTVVSVPLPDGVLHLKCACSAPAPDLVLLAAGTVAASRFPGARVVEIPAHELYAANAVGRAGRALVAAGHPATTAALRAAGLEVRELEVSEIRKGDGSLTCLSLRSEGDAP